MYVILKDVTLKFSQVLAALSSSISGCLLLVRREKFNSDKGLLRSKAGTWLVNIDQSFNFHWEIFPTSTVIIDQKRFSLAISLICLDTKRFLTTEVQHSSSLKESVTNTTAFHVKYLHLINREHSIEPCRISLTLYSCIRARSQENAGCVLVI